MARVQQKRLVPYILIAATILFFFYALKAPTHPDALFQPPGAPANHGAPLVQKVNWRKYKQRYPVKNFRPLPAGKPKDLPQVQFDFGKEDQTAAALREARRGDVKKAFQKAWKSYKENAWLQPCTSEHDSAFHQRARYHVVLLRDGHDLLA